MILYRFLIIAMIFLFLLLPLPVLSQQQGDTTKQISAVPAKRGSTKDTTTADYKREFAVQVGAFAIKENAELVREQFLAEGYRADVYENFLDGKKLLYLIWVGSFPTREEAESALDTIRTKHEINGILRTRTAERK